MRLSRFLKLANDMCEGSLCFQQFVVLTVIAEEHPLPVVRSKLGQTPALVETPKATIYRLVKNLIDKGLVTTGQEAELGDKDKRYSSVYLTDKGLNLWQNYES
jgi:DNA-binding MarR family transcriptional regulator